MLDINFIRENHKQVERAAKDKGIDLDLSRLLELDEKRRKLIARGDELRMVAREIAQQVPEASGDERQALIARGKDIKTEVQDTEAALAQIQDEYDELMYQVPNIPSEDTPVGGEKDFEIIDEWGEKPKFDFEARDHIELGQMLDVIDLERGVKVSGYRGYFLKNEGALLQQAILTRALMLMRDKGFTPMVPPALVRESALFGSGHFPGERQEIYELDEYSREREKEQKFLAGTAEPALLSYYADEVLDEKDLPIKLSGISPCYRREVGGYGKDTKGVYRIHEFMKVEQVVFAPADLEQSEQIFQEMNENARELLRELNLPHRVIQIATQDMGPGKYKMYDIETWMAGRGSYGETHSNSNLTDWQARRLNIRYKDKKGKSVFVYTLNNTVVASPRILIAILENNQQKDGSVVVPDVLREIVGTDIIRPKQASSSER